ncbi:hypothetical protein GCM10009592_18520 [Brachybacterium rhamnosum]|uniref:Uncharacterized protein n=1 Tax=Brachybacterium rhamnosum TaxID=173361 RepID=A0ABW4PX67_9MICO
MTERTPRAVAVSTWWQPWPVLSMAGSTPLRPGAAMLALEVGGEAGGEFALRLRYRIADDGRSLRTWPDDPPSSDARVPSVLLGQDSTTSELDVWFERKDLDDEDLPLAHSALAPSAPAQWHLDPPPGPEGAIIGGLAELLRRSIESEPAPLAEDAEVLLLPGILDDGAPADLAQPSWHARRGGALLRLLERPPLRREEDDGIRARWGEVHDASHPYAAHGTVVWWPGTVRWWGGGMVPGVDEPLALSSLRPAERLLADRLEQDPAFD